uniref:OMP_b-brl domain-containing protein n=1 Tax=Ascaris lumbricoides TaxID=6252 RepID=A0A0M3HWJ7_ASCLU
MKQQHYWGVLLAFWYHFELLDALYHITAERPGYNNEYRISPDLGYYVGCQKAISLYISQLATGKTPTWNATNANCPLYQLPNTYKGYLACDFVRGRWYAMSFESSIRYELYHNKAYRQFWSNHSSVFLVKPDYLLQRNGTEIDWLTSLLTFRIR